jgi:POT family proton-dependent oligopeptide transporter
LQEENGLRDRQYTALSEVVELAKGQQWEKAQTKVIELPKLFPPGRMKRILAVVLEEMSKPAGLILLVSGFIAFAYLAIETFRLDKVPRERMLVVLILTFFSMLFWAFFEQAGSSVNNFTDRNVDRVFEQSRITVDDVGKTIKIQPTQEQLGFHNGNQLFTLNVLDKLRDTNREEEKDPDFEIEWEIAEDNVGMGIATRVQEMPASIFQSVNPIYILIFGLVFTALWAVLAKYNLEPSTPVKFALGLFQLGLGFAAFWYGAYTADQRGMVALAWLFVGYLLQTTGELCLSPVGLSMVSKLSPARLVSTVMGMWFLATAFSQLLAAIIAQFTGVVEESNGGEGVIPIPNETVDVYGGVFGTVAISAIASALICFALAPLLSRWMHPSEDILDEPETEEQT